eukprot:TRINITY_DN31075_c0_g1_i1.p1 TRINITY_DN31075_c0_g1~~TRINITY_DN31075_c0_g1_i1.p1  ORF type:complete len:493 (-),score=91.02 TRINITY_DN31075_c0_g1_i1:134-1612(-)
MENSDAKKCVEVQLMTMNGEECSITLAADATVRQAKQEIERVLNIPELEQRLLDGALVLDDEMTPFLEVSERIGAVLQVLRQPRMTLKMYLQTHPLLEETPTELERLLRQAANDGEECVCREILYEPMFGAQRPNEDLLSCLAVGGLADAFELLVEHEHFGKLEGMLDLGFEALHLAAKRGLTVHCRVLLSSPNFHAAGEIRDNGCTALHHAANDSVLQTLLEHEALASSGALNATDRFGCTCLHYASSERMIQTILHHPNFHSVNVADNSGQTALHCARSAAMCIALLKHPEFDALNKQDNHGRTALHLLARKEESLVALVQNCDLNLLSSGVNVIDDQGRSALHNAASANVCTELFEAGFTALNAQDHMGRTALHTCASAAAARCILTHSLFRALDDRCNVDFPRNELEHLGLTALAWACRGRRDDVVLEILTCRSSEHSPQSLEEAYNYYIEGLGPEAARALTAALLATLEAKRVGSEEAMSRRTCQIL